MKDIAEIAKRTKTRCEVERLNQLDDISTYKGQWTALFILKDEVICGNKGVDTEQEVIDLMEEWLACIRSEGISIKCRQTQARRGYFFFPEDYVAYVPVPLMKPTNQEKDTNTNDQTR